MARLKTIIHSTDSCMMIFKGNLSNPEPSTGVIKFPGGFVEVSRCTDGSYYAHICADKSANIIESRIDYDYEGYTKNAIPNIPDQDNIEKLAIKVKGEFLSYD